MPRLRELIPELQIEEEFKDLPIVAFSFLTVLLKECYARRDEAIIKKAVILLDELAEQENADLRGLIDEVAIGLYDANLGIYENFKERLMPEAATKFEETITMWRNQ